MGGSFPPTSPSDTPGADRLDSWKEIAEYFRRDVTTVQRWEKRERMPVHRHLHDRTGSVFAFRSELDAWARGRSVSTAQGNGEKEKPSAEGPAEGRQRFAFLRTRIFAVSATLAAILVIAGLGLWLQRTEYFWRSPIAGARFQRVTDFEGAAQAAAVSRDGKFVAFLSDRDGKMDVWVTQVGSGEFHNLTHGNAPELVNPSIRNLGFSPDGSLVTFWIRKQTGGSDADIDIWAVPTLGGEPRPYLQGVAELDWSPDGSRIAYHTPGPGDPLFLSDSTPGSRSRFILTAPSGLHSHFPLWSPDAAFIYFVRGSLPDNLDIWRVRASGGSPQQITSQHGHVTYPVFLDRHTLLYLANDTDGSGPWLYSVNVERRIPHRLTSGFDRYTSLAASADGRRIVLTLASPKNTLWRLRLDTSPAKASPARISLTTNTGSSPRLGPGYLLYVSGTGTSESIWKYVNGSGTELWRGDGAQILGGPAISPDGGRIAFSVQLRGRTYLYTMQADGANVRVVTDALRLQGAPAWAPDGKSITSAADERGVPHLFRIPADGGSPVAFVPEYSLDPAWAPDGRFLLYSGADVGTTFSVKAAVVEAVAHPLPNLTMTRGGRHLAFVDGGQGLVVLQGEIQHKNLWLIDLRTGTEKQLTNLPPDFDVSDFDISPDGQDAVLERAETRSDIVLLDLPRR